MRRQLACLLPPLPSAETREESAGRAGWRLVSTRQRGPFSFFALPARPRPRQSHPTRALPPSPPLPSTLKQSIRSVAGPGKQNWLAVEREKESSFVGRWLGPRAAAGFLPPPPRATATRPPTSHRAPAARCVWHLPGPNQGQAATSGVLWSLQNGKGEGTNNPAPSALAAPPIFLQVLLPSPGAEAGRAAR